MMIHFDDCLRRLSNNAAVIQQLVAGVQLEAARWKPDAESWSMLEVTCHLADEEREDFKPKIQVLFNDPVPRFHSIDPQAWVTERAYNQRDLAASIADFLAERQRSLEWLHTLPAATDWDMAYEQGNRRLSAGDLLTAWIAHDLLHIRQLNELHYAYFAQLMSPYSPDYAGDW